MVTRISRSFIQEANGLPIQCHELALEPDVSHLSNVIFSIAPVIFKEESDRCSRIPVSSVEGQLENIRTDNRLWDLDGLCWREL